MARDFCLAGWLVQPALNRVTCGERVVHLRPKAMDVLVLLAQRSGQVVRQEVIIDTVWAKEFIGDSALKTAVFELRAAFSDDPHAPKIIETIPKRGYRLVAPVEWRDAGAAEVPANCSPFALIVGNRRIVLAEGENLIGRVPEVRARIDSIKVSRHHARITVSGCRAVLEDLGSKNGTFVRGERVEAPVELADGDRITIGEVVLVFRVTGIPGSTETGQPPESV